MANRPHNLLLVAEDSDEDFEILQLLMQRMAVKNQVYRCTNGDDVLEVLYQSDNSQFDLERLAVILLDLNLPGLDGRDVLEQVKQDQRLKEIPIVVFQLPRTPVM